MSEDEQNSTTAAEDELPTSSRKVVTGLVAHGNVIVQGDVTICTNCNHHHQQQQHQHQQQQYQHEPLEEPNESTTGGPVQCRNTNGNLQLRNGDAETFEQNVGQMPLSQAEKYFLDIVKRYPCLYDPDNPNYANQNIVWSAWQDVATATGKTDAEAKRMFSLLELKGQTHSIMRQTFRRDL